MSEGPGNGLDGLAVTTSAHSIEMVMKARVLLNGKGEPETIILTGDQGVEMRWPGYGFPFIKNGASVFVITSVVQVSKAEPKLAPQILRPGN